MHISYKLNKIIQIGVVTYNKPHCTIRFHVIGQGNLGGDLQKSQALIK